MRANTIRLITVLLAVTLLSTGCAWVRRAGTPPRAELDQNTVSADMETLKHDNEALRKSQAESRAQMEELQRLLAQSQEEQRRFRQSMTTNFDLLEQSVALTLSRSVNQEMGQAAPAPEAVSRAVAPPPAQPALAQAPRTAPPMSGASPQGMQAMTSTASPSTAEPSTAKPAPIATAQGGQVKSGGSTPTGGAAMAALSPAPAGREEPVATDPDLMAPQSPARLVAHKEAKPLYEKGFALFARKEYDQSILVFRNFLSRFPDDIYSDNAQFWIGESYSGLHRPEEAEQAYRQVLRQYEHRSTLEGFKTPDAIYRLGQAYQAREDRRRARMYYEALAERFPETSAGRKAQRELDTMGMKTAAN